jgi:hypothetical protein
MPANADAWRRAGLPEPTAFENSAAVEDPKFAFLGDVFYIPDRFPLANVFSIGDVLIVIGGTYLAHRWCGLDSPVASRTTGPATSRPDTPAVPTELPVA